MPDGGRRPRRGVPAALVAIIVGLLVLGAAVVAVAPTPPPRDDRPRLALPPAGEIAAAHVLGRPVFVVHDRDGSVRVLDAVVADGSFPKVLAWCRTSQWFEDLWHGSRFDRLGRWTGGPAPTGMAPYRVVGREAGAVVVAERQPPPAREQPVRGPAELPPEGPACDDRTALYLPDHPADPAVLDDLIVHVPPPGHAGRDLWYPTPERVLGETPRSSLG